MGRQVLDSAELNGWLERYEKMLIEDQKGGLEEPDDVLDARRFTQPVRRGFCSASENKMVSDVVVTSADQNDHTLLTRLDNIFYRTLYGQERDDSFEPDFPTEVLVARKNVHLVGGIWYAIEPTQVYEGFLYLDRMVVVDRERGQNIGTKMLVNLLEYVPEGKSVILHAWDKAIPFYVCNGFFSAGEDVEGEDGCFFRKMVLPLDWGTFQDYKQEGWQEELQAATRDEIFFRKIRKALEKNCEESFTELSSNPFTAVLYRNAGIDHRLLK